MRRAPAGRVRGAPSLLSPTNSVGATAFCPSCCPLCHLRVSGTRAQVHAVGICTWAAIRQAGVGRAMEAVLAARILAPGKIWARSPVRWRRPPGGQLRHFAPPHGPWRRRMGMQRPCPRERALPWPRIRINHPVQGVDHGSIKGSMGRIFIWGHSSALDSWSIGHLIA